MAQDVGIKISKPLYDATTAADADLLFSSSWPSLPIANEYIRTVSGLPYTTTIAHGLGYVPFVLGWKKTGTKWSKSFFGYNDGIQVDATNIYINITGNYPYDDTGSDPPTSLHLKVYAIDISTEVEYELSARSSIVTQYNPDYGIKIAKELADINSDDMRDFILHSRCQSPLILSCITQASGTITGTGGTITYVDPQGYLSWVFGFMRATATGRYRAVPYYAQAYPTTQINTATKTYTQAWNTASGDNGGSILVLRDPMFSASTITGSY